MIKININLKKLEFNTNNAALLTVKSFFSFFKNYKYPSTSTKVLEAFKFEIKEYDKVAIISDNPRSSNTLIDIIRGASYCDTSNNIFPKKFDYISGNIFLSEFFTLKQLIDLCLGLKKLKYTKKYYLDYFYKHLDYSKFINVRIRNLLINFPLVANQYNAFISSIFNEDVIIMQNIDNIFMREDSKFITFFEDHLFDKTFITSSNDEKIIKKYFSKILVIEKNKQFFFGDVKQIYNYLHLLAKPKDQNLSINIDNEEDDDESFL